MTENEHVIAHTTTTTTTTHNNNDNDDDDVEHTYQMNLPNYDYVPDIIINVDFSFSTSKHFRKII